MTTYLLLLAIVATLVTLVRYARQDRFAGPATLAERHDELGSLHSRGSLVPRS